MKIEIISEERTVNSKDKELCGTVKQSEIYTVIDGITTVFLLRFKIKNGKVTTL